MFETSVSDLQSGLTVENGAITGTLKKLSTGPIADYWGEGYFMALKFTDNDEGEATISLTIAVNSVEHLNTVIAKLRKITGIHSISRG